MASENLSNSKEVSGANDVGARNFWDSIHADNLLYAMRHVPSQWRGDLMEAHLHLSWHFAHDENERHDFCARRGIKSVLHISGLVTQEVV